MTNTTPISTNAQLTIWPWLFVVTAWPWPPVVFALWPAPWPVPVFRGFLRALVFWVSAAVRLNAAAAVRPESDRDRVNTRGRGQHQGAGSTPGGRGDTRGQGWHQGECPYQGAGVNTRRHQAVDQHQGAMSLGAGSTSGKSTLGSTSGDRVSYIYKQLRNSSTFQK